MNKIIIVNDEIKKIKLDDSVKLETHKSDTFFSVNRINLEIKESTKLFLNIDLKTHSKLSIDINTLNNVTLELYIITSGVDGKIRYTYNLNLNSNVYVYKYNNIDNIKECVISNLNNENANFNYNFKGISSGKETYDYIVNHNAKKSISNVKNNCVNLTGDVIIQITSVIPKEISDCVTNQFNRIINLSDKKCEIRPILYIDTDMVDANHSALIGDFDASELFYLQTMGISKKEAHNLLIKGFLLSDITFDKIKDKILADINDLEVIYES